jgi:multiple sugar transport system ATP-binding protein
MGRAIVRQPDLFLFDEPLSNLDAKLRVQMRTEIKELHQRLTTTTCYVTHDQIEAMTMADVIVIMKDGHVEQVGRPLDVYDHPVNLFVAEFIGSPAMNLISGEVDGEAGRPAFRLASGLTLPLPEAVRAERGRKVVYGVRPEHLALTTDGPALATVNVLEPTGPELHIYADLAGHEICAVSRDRLSLTPGSEIRLSPSLDRVHLSDVESGRSLATA